ncbi:hypothetical protein LINGRAPRIM_LOCUS2322 [Linum grandiflorum]
MEDVTIEDVSYEENAQTEPMEETELRPNVWTQRSNRLFENSCLADEWYIEDSDSEDVVETMREEDDVLDEDTYDLLCLPVLFSAAEKASFRRVWRSALVVRGLGRRIPYSVLAPILNFLWARDGPLKISDLQNGCFLVRFKSKQDYEWAIAGGPWMLGETYLTVHQWYRGFNPWTSEVSTTIVWVQLSDLPIEFYNTLAVKRIARRIGHPICVDRATDEGARGKYARVCVEVDLTKPLLSKYLLEGKKYLIAYEGLHGLCTICGMYKKSSDLCKCQLPPEHEMNDVSSDHGNLGEETIEKAAYGGWMNAPTRKQRGKKNFPKQSNEWSGC